MRYVSGLLLALSLGLLGCTEGDNNSSSVHCFNQTRRLPSFTSVDCPTINPTTNTTTTPAP